MEKVQEVFNKAFNDVQIYRTNEYIPFRIENLTLRQLWWLVKFSKHVRGRCRSNAAFNNYMNRVFPNAQFSTVPKEYNGKLYQGLKITVNGETMEGEDNE